MKYITSVVGLLLIAASANAAVFSTNISQVLNNPAHRLMSTNANVYQIQISTTSASGAVVDFYDCNQLTAPAFGTNYTNAPYHSRTVFTTNYGVANVGATGTTNWITNSGIYTLSVSNAANTNLLPKMVSLAVGANQAVIADVDVTFTKGICVLPNTNISIILYYKPNN